MRAMPKVVTSKVGASPLNIGEISGDGDDDESNLAAGEDELICGDSPVLGLTRILAPNALSS